MGKSGKKKMTVYMLLAFVFITMSIVIAVSKINGVPPEYTMGGVVLLLGVMGAMQCSSLQKRQELLDTLEESMKRFKLTCTDDD